MTDQIPPTEYDSFNTPSCTPQQADDPGWRPESEVIPSPVVWPDYSVSHPSAGYLSTQNPAPDSVSAGSTDESASDVPQPSGPSKPDRKYFTTKQKPNFLSTHKRKRTLLSSWWREITATILSITSMGLVWLVVLKLNKTALKSWNFHIGSLAVQPNTVIDILTVAGQTLMMVPVTAAIGQLKWTYFLRPRHLHHMQLMDDASRGSLLLLFRVASSRSAMASLLALVTIMALGIGPSAQQILAFRPAQVLLQNATAEIGLATSTTRNLTCLVLEADPLTNQIRSTSPGDNLNSTRLAGKAYINERYIYVRWHWIVLPLAETLLTGVFLAISIISTRSGPLLKSSVLAYLFHLLEGLTAEELNMAGNKTSSELETLSEKVMAKFEIGQDGRLRFSTV